MQKEFKLTDPKKAPARLVDAIKHDIKKYIARERRKTLAEGVDFWDFDCKVGKNKTNAVTVNVNDISKGIDQVVSENSAVVYVEILAKPGHRAKKA